MQVISALFVEEFNMRQVDGPSTRLDLSGVMFSLVTPSPPPVTIEPTWSRSSTALPRKADRGSSK